MHVILKFNGKVLCQKPLIDLNLSLEIRPQIIKRLKFWRDTVHGVARGGNDLATKSPPQSFERNEIIRAVSL